VTASSSLEIIKEIKKKKREGSRFIVWGCLPKIDPEALKIEYVGLTFSEAELSLLDQMFGSNPSIEKTTVNTHIQI
jgi:hypothetical protein